MDRAAGGGQRVDRAPPPLRLLRRATLNQAADGPLTAAEVHWAAPLLRRATLNQAHHGATSRLRAERAGNRPRLHHFLYGPTGGHCVHEGRHCGLEGLVPPRDGLREDGFAAHLPVHLARLRLGVARLARLRLARLRLGGTWALLRAAVLDHVVPRRVAEAPGPSLALPEPPGVPARESLAAALG